MIPNNTKRGTVTNNLGALSSTKLTVDTENMQHIMGLLTNIYSDEALAIIREYSTNAWDAQLDAGVATPIEVSTPTRLAPFLKIKDNGVGMDADTMKTLYASYGKSTKREQKGTNGSMGIGCKSALAYGDQFTVVSVKDGVKTTASISRAADDSADMDIIDVSATNESNGTEVVIPARPEDDFDNKAQNLFKFWAEGTVLINGKEPDRSDLERMTDRIYFHNGEYDLIVMGNVAYPVTERKHAVTSNGRKTATFVTMNGDDEVVFHPSREHLIYNGITTNVLAGIREEFVATIKEFIKSEIDKAPNFVEAYRLMRKYKDEYGAHYVSGLTYKDTEFSEKMFTFTENGMESRYRFTVWHPERVRGSVFSEDDLSMSVLNSARMIVVGYTGNGVSSMNKTRLRNYMQAHSITASSYGYWDRVVLLRQDTLPEPKMTDGFTVHNWKTIMAETKQAVVRNTGTGFSYGGKYDVYNADTESWSIEALPSDAEILYFSPKWVTLKADIRDRILRENPDIVFVKAAENRHTKLKREYKNAKHYNAHEWITKFAKADFDALSDDTLLIAQGKVWYSDGYEWINGRYKHRDVGVAEVPKNLVASLADPEYRDAATLYHTVMPDIGLAAHDPRWDALQKKAAKEKFNKPEFNSRYPLANWSQFPGETLDYVNAIYNQTKEK